VKFHKRFAPILTGFLLSGLMTLIIAGVTTLRHLGLHEGFVTAWLLAFLNGWAISFPTVLVVAPIVRRLVDGLLR
jgi:hypothetical protein